MINGLTDFFFFIFSLQKQKIKQGIHSVLRTPSQTMLAPPGAPYYIPTIEHGEVPPAHSGGLHLTQLGLHPIPMYSQPITDAQVALARLHKQGHRPLGRTQSAPLPLGHPMLTGAAALNIAQTHYENSEAERQAYEQQHLQLTQKIRQTVLTRSGRADSFKEEEDAVIDLTDKKQPPKTVPSSTVISSTLNPPPAISPEERLRDQEYLQQQREILIRQSMQVNAFLAAHSICFFLFLDIFLLLLFLFSGKKSFFVLSLISFG